MKKIKIGRISGAQGLRGEVRIYHDSGEEEALKRLTSLFLSKNGEQKPFAIERLRMHKRTPVLKLKGVDDRNSAEALTGLDVFVYEGESRPDEEGAWLASELEGMEVYLQDEDTVIGHIKSILSNPAHDILEIQTPKGVLLLPFVDAFILRVDIEKGSIVIVPPDDWLG